MIVLVIILNILNFFLFFSLIRGLFSVFAGAYIIIIIKDITDKIILVIILIFKYIARNAPNINNDIDVNKQAVLFLVCNPKANSLIIL